MYNNSYHDTINEKPSYIMFNRDLSLPFHLLEQSPRMHYFPCDNYINESVLKMQSVYRKVYQNLETAAAKQSRLRDKVAKSKSFELGQKVYLYIPATNQSTGRAFAKKFHGPYRVIEKHSDLNYTIQDCDKPFSKRMKVHVDRIFDYTERRQDLSLSSRVKEDLSNRHDRPNLADNPSNEPEQFTWYDDVEFTEEIPPSKQIREPRLENKSASSGKPSNNLLPVAKDPLNDNTTNIGKKVGPKPKGTRTKKIWPEPSHSYEFRSRPDNKDKQTESKPSASFTDRVLGWAMNSGDKNSTNIIDKMSNALAHHLATDLEKDKINNIKIKLQPTRIFYNSTIDNVNFS